MEQRCIIQTQANITHYFSQQKFSKKCDLVKIGGFLAKTKLGKFNDFYLIDYGLAHIIAPIFDNIAK